MRQPTPYPPRRALVGWVLFDWACQPFFTLVATFVFAPYFVTVLAPNPIEGQALWGYATAAAGLALALISPVLGSLADASGPKKPWIAGCGVVLITAAAALWYVETGGVTLALVAFAIATVAIEVAIVFNNAMMPHLAPPERLGSLSGTGWAAGYAGGLVSLAIVLGLLAAVPETGRTLFGVEPLFGLDPERREGDRITGPLFAFWFAIFVLPLFLFTPDAPRTGKRLAEAIRHALAQLAETAAEARRDSTVARFLLAHMLYQDGLVVLFSLGGVYGAGLFGWGSAELGVFGVLATVAGMIGALVGGRLDDRFGAKPVILGALILLVVFCLGVLSLRRDHILFAIAATPPLPGDGLYGSLPEKLFVACGFIIGAVAGPLQASSRSLLARLVPAEAAGCYFGLLAFSGNLTSFLPSLLVALATEATGVQGVGLVALIAFFGAGAMLLSGVRRA
jgi:UMF1 family MFS transporter